MIHTAADLGRATVVVVIIFAALTTFVTWIVRRIEGAVFLHDPEQ